MVTNITSVLINLIPASNGTNVPVKIVDANLNRYQVVFQNRMSGTIIIGTLANLTANPVNGLMLETGSTFTELTDDALYAIALSSARDSTGALLISDYNN